MRHLINHGGKMKMANSFLPCPQVKRRAHFLGQFERICQTFFTETHNLKINPKELSGFGVHFPSGAFIFLHPGLDYITGTPAAACSVVWRASLSCRCLLLKPEQEEEVALSAPGPFLFQISQNSAAFLIILTAQGSSKPK